MAVDAKSGKRCPGIIERGRAAVMRHDQGTAARRLNKRLMEVRGMEKRSFFVQEIYTECTIDAPAGDVWAVISDLEHYAGWTSGLVITGNTQPGGKMYVQVKTAGNGSGWFRLTSTMERNTEGIIAFTNVLYAPFLFRGRHRFSIIPLSDTQARFINTEVFSGIAVPFVRRKTLLDVTRKFKERTNADLKMYVEARAGQTDSKPHQ